MMMCNIEVQAEHLVDQEDLELLARVVYMEAGGQGKECMEAVASVIVNRVLSEYYPDTLHDVIYQKGQYSTANKKCNYISDDAYECAYYILQYGSILPGNVLYQHYKRPVKGTKIYKVINHEYFSM